MGDWFGGLADDVAGAVPDSGVIPDQIQDPVTGREGQQLVPGGSATSTENILIATPLAPLVLDPQGDNDEIADNIGEGLLSPGEQYNPEGPLETGVNAGFDDSNFNPDADGGDTIDLPGPGTGEFLQDPAAAVDPFGENQQFALLFWGAAAFVALWALGPAMQAGAEVAS
ncbi:hypothetical protein [Haloarchaeobius litoreus]|uniref:PGF-CTERM protein n=1 Tax=Haloarchaeobius litoreus TaxID=755306 RepID=A0ABD6DHS4_9EURY|nr:hypothetical protein [Haloarchaeobius litoreus]